MPILRLKVARAAQPLGMDGNPLRWLWGERAKCQHVCIGP